MAGEYLWVEHRRQRRRYHARPGWYQASALCSQGNNRLARGVADQEREHRPEPQRLVYIVPQFGPCLLDMVIQPLPLQVLLPLKLDRRCPRLLQGTRARQELIDGMGGRPHYCRPRPSQ